ncbi:hypothetical protein [Amycolatopsis sulphurea]
MRRILGQMVAATVGVFGQYDFTVTLSGNSATVSPGQAVIPAAANETGVYIVESTESVALRLDPADSTRDRTDRLVAYVIPPATATDTGRWAMEIRKGAPAASPVPPVVPNAFVVCDFAVPAASKGVVPSVFDQRFTESQHYISGPTLAGLKKPPVGRTGQLWMDASSGHVFAWNGSMWAGVSDPALPRGWVGEVKRTTTDTFNAELLMERLTVPLSTGRRYKATFTTNHFAAGTGPPNGTANIRLAAGTSVTLTSPILRSSGILKNNVTRQPWDLLTTFTVTTSGTYTLGISAAANGDPTITFPGDGGRCLLLEDIGAA